MEGQEGESDQERLRNGSRNNRYIDRRYCSVQLELDGSFKWTIDLK